MSYRTIVCIPNHHDNLDFLKEWEELKDTEIIIMQDIGPKPPVPSGFNVTIFDHDDVKADLGVNDWIIPSQTSACRSYGYYKAWQRQPDYIMTVDNDCYPERSDYWKDGHVQMLNSPVTLDWINTAKEPYLRGFPYTIRDNTPVILNHGLWSNIPDLDGQSMLKYPDLRFDPSKQNMAMPRYSFFPMCGMNLAWRAELTPALYFGLFGPTYGFDQFDDIWAGVLVKKIVDHLRFGVRSGFPSVEHRKQSDAQTNIRKQTPGMAMNETFWRVVQQIELTKDTIIDCYQELITKLPDVVENELEGWTKKFKEAALIWIDLFIKKS